jgi:hypothetical protein
MMTKTGSHEELSILPSTGLWTLLNRYPELEEVLIALAPPFKKLKNPILRNGIARIATLAQVAAVGKMTADTLVNKLRAAVGQECLPSIGKGDTSSYFSDQPEWFDANKIVSSIDDRNSAASNTMPIVTVLQRAAHLQPAEILELITTFLPAPGIDVMRRKGFRIWSIAEDNLVRTYVSKQE